jgi:4-amino-4-deoxy-L-arabinose transferase-like glycosyltransferase
MLPPWPLESHMRTSACRNDIVPIGALMLIGSLALVHLMALPAFEDEGSQLRLVWRLIEAREWLQPLSEGKPLEAWLMVPLALLGGQPLAAIRALHVLVGMIGAVMTYRLGREVTGRLTAWVCGALFAICPFVVYLQRLALADILLCTAGTWVLVSVLRFAESPTRPRAAALASSLVLAAFCKFPVGFVFLISMPLALALMPTAQRRPLLQAHLTRLPAALAPVALLGLAVIAVGFIRWRRGQLPGFGLQDLLGIGLGHYQSIAAEIGVPRPTLLRELSAPLSAPVVAIGLLGIAAGAILGDWRQRWLIAVGAVPMLAIGFLAEFWFSRYLLFTIPPLIIAAVCGWRSIALRAGRLRRPCEMAVLAVCAALMVRQSALLIFDPEAANWSPLDRYQYFEGPGSGYGYPEAAKFILAAADAPPIVYSLDGHSAYQLRNYLPPEWSKRISPISFAADGKALHSEDERFSKVSSRTPAWLIVPEQLLQIYMISMFGEKNVEQLELRRLASFEKPGLRARLAIYEITRR